MSRAADDGCGSPVNEHERATKPFRFKRPTGEEGSETKGNGNDSRRSHRRQQNRRYHHSRHKRRKLSDDDATPNPTLDPDAAFRESLFDALGDDEGAEYWQGVYGQPIHAYPKTYTDAETGELETMNDEQYAQYVRRKMWEKSAEGLELAREAHRRERQAAEQEKRKAQSDTKSASHTLLDDDFVLDPVFDFEIDASLKRGQQRRDRKKWQQVWQSYQERWKELQNSYESRRGAPADASEQIFLRNKIAWPVESGKRKDVTPEAVARFIDKICSALVDAENEYATLKTLILKAERVKWHPDKIQQRFGFMHIEESTVQGVTAVFQALDDLWTQLRNQRS